MDGTELEHASDQRRIREERRRARNSKRLATLLEQRKELAGVSPVADFVVESVRWTA